MTSLRQVLDRLRSAKLTAKPSKCFIGYSSIECLGHNSSNRKAMNRNWSNQKSNSALKTKAGNK